MISKAVIGCGYGDEGKGRVVSYLCSQFANPLVVRFSGGQQAGHKVIFGGLEHICSNFGSGVLQGHDTYWAEFCTVDPVGIANELTVLQAKNVVIPKLFIHAKCPVTTPFEKERNIRDNSANKHGSCGVGVGATYRREDSHYSLLAEDLLYPSVCKIKIGLIQKYYGFDLTDEIQCFFECCSAMVADERIVITQTMPNNNYDAVIFEGSQGLLLDQCFGFFPYVTPSNTGTKNICKMGFMPDVYYIIRAFQTRHGNGPLTNEGDLIKISNTHEHNVDGNYQGAFRMTPLDVDMLRYAIAKDGYEGRKILIITCLDAIQEYRFSVDNGMKRFNNEKEFVSEIKTLVGIETLLVSRSPYGEMEEW